MLSTDVWLEAAQRANLKLGSRRRFQHNCGPGDVVLVTATVKGLHAYCFRCNESRLIRRELSLAEKIAAIKAQEQALEELRECKLPSDFTLEIPQEHAVWLYKASITKAQAKELGIGWSAGLQRIVLPVYGDDGELAFIQARAVKPGQTPKYLNTRGANAAKALFQTAAIEAGTPFVVITEDMLSAIRCGLYGPAVALCGVSVSEAKALRLLKARTLLCWLDPDPAGQKAMRKFIRAVSLLHPDVRLVHSEKDPKLLTNARIWEHIERTLNATRDNSVTDAVQP